MVLPPLPPLNGGPHHRRLWPFDATPEPEEPPAVPPLPLPPRVPAGRWPSEGAPPAVARPRAAVRPIQPTPASVSQGYATMRRDIRWWGVGLLVLGVGHFLGSRFLHAPWGIMFILAGLASFYFREAALFLVYAVILAWAGLGDLFGGILWALVGLAQLFLAFRLIQQFFRFRRVEASHATLVASGELAEPALQRARRVFPWLASLLGVVALAGLQASVLATILTHGELPVAVDLALELVVDLGFLGLASGLAAILSGYGQRAIAALGIVTSSLVLLIYFSLPLLL